MDRRRTSRGIWERIALSLEFPEAAFPLKIGTRLAGHSRPIPRPPPLFFFFFQLFWPITGLGGAHFGISELLLALLIEKEKKEKKVARDGGRKTVAFVVSVHTDM